MICTIKETTHFSIETKQRNVKMVNRFSKVSHLWALTFLFLTSTFSLTAAGQSSDDSGSTPAGRAAQVGLGTSPLPHQPEPCKRKEACQGGITDNFAEPADAATPSPWLIENMGACVGIHTEFDTVPPEGHCFGHSFVECLNTKCKVIGARLEIRMQAIRNLSHNDGITIFSGGQQLWAKPITMLTEANSTWIPNQTATFLIDLGALPGGGDVLNQLAGSVDVTIQDDTLIDYMRLTVVTDCCGRACGTKYQDKNGNGLREADEPSLCGWTMILDGGQGNAQATTTDSSGGYCFDQVQPGAYSLGEMAQTGWTQTSPPSPGQHILNIAAGQEVDGLDFGNRLCEAGCTLDFALDFDGEDDYVEVSNTHLLDDIDSKDFTLEAWVKGLESEQGSHPPIMQNRPSSNDGFFFGFHNKWGGSANMIPFLKLGGVNWIGAPGFPSPPNLLDGNWHHFAARKKGKTLTYFADGQIVGSFTDPAIKAASIKAAHPLMIGWDPLTSAFDGMIDNLCIWSVARTQCGIQTDMIALPAATTPDLVACWAMDEGLGQIAGDYVAGYFGRLGSIPTTDVSDPVWVGASH